MFRGLVFEGLALQILGPLSAYYASDPKGRRTVPLLRRLLMARIKVYLGARPRP